MTKPTEVLNMPVVDRAGAHYFSVRTLHEFGVQNGYLDATKVKDLWLAFKDNPVLFTDDTEGKFESFFDVLINPNSCWYELYDEIDRTTKGVYSVTDIIPGYDAVGHFAFWDRVASGREMITWRMMRFFFARFELPRMSAEIPAYQTGTIRSAEKLGFIQEGVKRKGAKRKGNWVDLILMGILREELEEAIANGTAEKEERNSA